MMLVKENEKKEILVTGGQKEEWEAGLESRDKLNCKTLTREKKGEL